MIDKCPNRELDALIDACLEGRLSKQEAEQLSQRIEESDDARQRYWEMALVHGLIEQTIQNASLKALTGGDPAAVETRMRRLSRWPRITAVAAGIVIGVLSASLVWAYKSPSTGRDQRKTTQILFESFEDPSIRYSGRFPIQAGVWHGDLITVKPVEGVPPMRGNRVAKMSPVSPRKFSYARRIIDVSALPPLAIGEHREIEVQASFASSNLEETAHYQIRLAVFKESPQDIRPIWNDESLLFNRVLNHIGKNHIASSMEAPWHKMRASIELPPEASCVLVSLAVADVGRDSPHSERYLDAVRVRLVDRPVIAEYAVP